MTEGKICVWCGIEFQPKKEQAARQKYCSRGCKIKSCNAGRYSSEIPEACPECGDRIEQKEGRGRYRRYCSDLCRVKYNARRIREERQNQEHPKRKCPACGMEFSSRKNQQYCGEKCKTEWYKKQAQERNASQGPRGCKYCGKPLKKSGCVYCGQECYRKAMEQTREMRICPWCGSEFETQVLWGKRYCSQQCAVSDRKESRGVHRGRRRISEKETEAWKGKLSQAARASGPWKRGKRVRLVCGDTSINSSLDGLISIVRYTLRYDPYDGSVYVFRDSQGGILNYIEWDGQSFLQGKRRAQSGTYPWPPGEPGSVVEISEKEFAYLLSRSIVPFKEK